MTKVRNILYIGSGKGVEKIQNWTIISTFEYEIDVSKFTTGCDVATVLGNNLMNHLMCAQNPMGMKRIIGGPAYTYGQNRASATLFFEGSMTFSNAIPMKVSSYCEWVEPSDSHQHHFEKTPVFVGRGVRAVGTNESNTYRRTQRKNTVLRSANQYSRPQRRLKRNDLSR